MKARNDREDGLTTVRKPVNATAQEMTDARDWLACLLNTLRGTARPAVLECLRQSWGQMQVNRSSAEGPLCLAGRNYKTGIGTHGECDLQISLPPGSRRLTGLCGINDSDLTRGQCADQTFSIEVGGREVWNSGARSVSSPAARFDVPLRGARSVMLKVRGPIARAHVNWVNLQVDGVAVRALADASVGEVFRFRYGGVESQDVLSGWKLQTARHTGRGTIVRRFTRTDPRTGLVVTCEVTEYTKFPAVEWVVRLKNTSCRPTPLIEELRSMDLRFRAGRYPYLNYRTGDYYSIDGYEPFRVSLAHGEELQFAPMGGRGTNRAWPYYNLEWQDSARGVIAVVGWAGQWASRIAGDAKTPGLVYLSAGQQTTHFRLHPGEEVRTPTSLVMFYRGSRERSQNLWRRWYREHVMPRPDGQRMQTHLVGHGTEEGEEFTGATEENQIRFIRKWAKQKIPFDTWWIDAGWYPCVEPKEQKRRWARTGTWIPDPDRFPRGFKPVSDELKRHQAKLLIWFEPERVRLGTALDREHPEWLLKIRGKDDRLLDLGNPECRRWLTNHVCRLIRRSGIGIYRQDFNFEPLPYWQANDAPDRQGISENLHVQGYLKFWDNLLARNPGLWIDSCASGGRRNDLDTMRRSVPLHYTDYGYGDHPVKLAFHDGLCQWLPYFKEVTLSWDLKGNSRFDHQVDRYSYHCGFGPMIIPCVDIRREDYDYATVRTMLQIWKRVASLMLEGDYYAHTPIRRTPDQWVARQFDCPESGRGFVQAIRLPQAPQRALLVHPKALDPDATYLFENPETGQTKKLRGAKATADGIRFVRAPRQAALWLYWRL
jgi:alpha-galactosidase